MSEQISLPKGWVETTVGTFLTLEYGKGLSKKDSMLLNIANIRHRPEEVDKKNIDEIDFDWEF